jgi:hypothetical protein
MKTHIFAPDKGNSQIREQEPPLPIAPNPGSSLSQRQGRGKIGRFVGRS